MGKDKLPRIPTFAELGISEDEVEELEREIAQEAAARRRREAGRGAPAEEDRAARAGARAAPGRSGRAHGAGLAGGRGAVPAPGAAVPDRAPAPAGPSSAQPDPSPGTEEPERTQEISPAERKRRARQARKAERKQKALAAREAKRALRGKRGGTAEQSVGPEPDPAPAPWGGLRGPLTLVVLLFTAWFSSSYRSLPAPVPAGAPDSVFSSARAMAHLVRIASEARPTGSPAHGEVREYLLEELRGLGHEPAVQTSTSYLAGPALTRAATVRNVLARIPGSEPGGRAVLVTAHYDSRGIALGAGDDGSGVVTILETLRVLRVRGPLLNDLIVLLTDGEELGLLGARAFVDEHPWLDDVALVVSIEMRGGGGPSMMFETGENNGWVVDALRRADPYPSANSMGYEIYRRMPNDTDFTPFKEAGKQGLNFAAVGRPHVYHQVYDSPGNLSEATLQHHGEHAVAMLQYFGNADLADVDAPDVSYISVPFLGLVTYDMFWIWVLGAVAVSAWGLVFFAGRRLGSRTGAVMVGLLGWIVYLAMAGALGHYLFAWRSGAHPELGALHAGSFHVEGWYVLAIMCAALALAAVVAGVLRLRLTAAELAVGALIVPVGSAAAATVMFPMAAMNLQWPAIAGCAGALAVIGLKRRQHMGLLRWVAVLLAAVPVVVVLMPLTEAVWAAMGMELAAGLAVLMGIAFVSLVPTLDLLREPNGWWAPAGVLMAGGTVLAVGISSAAPSADRPAPSTLVYALDRETGSAWWGTDPSRGGSDPGATWAAGVAGPFDAPSAPDSLQSFTPRSVTYAVAQAEAVDAPPPSIAVVADSPIGPGDAFRLAVASAIGAEMMFFRFDDDGARLRAVNGHTLPDGAQSSILEHWGTREDGVLLDFTLGPADDLLRFTVVEHHLRPGELLGALGVDRFRRPSELAPNILTLSDRAMIRTRVSVNPVTGEVRIEDSGVPDASEVPDASADEGG